MTKGCEVGDVVWKSFAEGRYEAGAYMRLTITDMLDGCDRACKDAREKKQTCNGS